MNWFYSIGGEQKGPVTQAQLDALVAQGVIVDATLVWCEGMATWQPWSSVRPAAPPVADLSVAGTDAVPAGRVRCAECSRLFAEEETLRFGTDVVCAGCKPVYLQRLREGVHRPGQLVFATIWQRFVADFIDGLIVIVPLMILLMLFIGGMAAAVTAPGGGATAATGASMIALQVAMQLVFYGAYILYNTILVGRYGYTLGKKVMGLKIVHPDGRRLTYGRACGRAFAELLSGLTCYIGYLVAFFDAERRSLHDHICNTRVVKG